MRAEAGVTDVRAPAAASSVLVVADDLMWATRLVSQADRAGAIARVVRDASALAAAVAESPPALVVVDLGSRVFDGVDAISAASRLGVPVIGVSQHEDLALRKRALAAGAGRVYAYAKMHSDGVSVLREWLA
jgi:DNA-binding response OmpR family regulator